MAQVDSEDTPARPAFPPRSSQERGDQLLECWRRERAAGVAADRRLEGLYLPTDISPEQIFVAIGKLRLEARREIDRLIRFLDETENHMEIDCEPCDDDGDGEDAEPSLGSFDRMTDQSKSWRQVSIWAFPEVDGEVDDCDREDCDPDEDKQQPPEMMRPFYGAECATYPACNGGCGLGCTKDCEGGAA